MQGYSTPGLLYDDGFFSRSELNFNDNGAEPMISSGLLGLSDSLDRFDTGSASSFVSQLGEREMPPAPNDTDAGGSQINNSGGHTLNHGDNSFGLDVDNTNHLLMQDMLHHQIINHSGGNDNCLGGRDGRSSQAINGVTTQWEESMQDLQSLLALHGQHPGQLMNAAPMPPDPTTSSTFNDSGGLLRGYNLDKPAGFPNGKFPGESELLSFLQFPRSNSSSSALQAVGGHGGPVSAFPSNPGFRKGPVHSGNFIPGLYSSSLVGQHAPITFPGYPAPSLPSNYFNMSSPMVSKSSQLLHGYGTGKGAQHSLNVRASSSTIMDLEQARDQSCDDSVPGKLCSPLLFESTKRGGSESASLLSGKSGSEARGINHFATERQRREYLNEKYQTLRSLVPNPSKADRASIVADAIEYVKELKRTVQELQILVQEKRRDSSLKEVGTQGKRRRMSGDPMDIVVDTDGNDLACSSDPAGSLTRSFSSKVQQQLMTDPLSADGSHLRSSWLQRTSQSGTHVDVRIVHDDVIIKLTQRRRRGCLLHVMVTLYELQLDLQHANGATIGEHDIYLFNTKILEGTSTFAGYVATKLIEAVDRI